MKILFIAMPSIHFIRWVENLKNTDFELYWFDVLDRGALKGIGNVRQFCDWKRRKLPYIKGEYYISKKMPAVYEWLSPFLMTTVNEQLEKIIKEINPDVVHSFEMQGCSYPILQTMNKYPRIKWIYSCWGNDIYYYRNFKEHNKKIREVLNRVNFMHADCGRDAVLAAQMGFAGKDLGVIPTGGGFRLATLEKYKQPVTQRKIILVKGYQHIFGRALNVVKALEGMPKETEGFEIVVFGAHPVVADYIAQQKLPFSVYGRHDLEHQQTLELMGKSLIYIGNNISDGMPNTLLEAIIMGAYPIQSNPGGASAEIINNGVNGLLIENPEDIENIRELIIVALKEKEMMEEVYEINKEIAKQQLDYESNTKKIIEVYKSVQAS
ncbi:MULTISPECIES: glycosyltransferase [unclassified Flavobacterium]|uniref:glycosyltransferase n=1 Tax=unclassified Flavobacterium TaxID=196869 RepID=UPI0009634190|nr:MULTISPECIES: glycosyltransferase [unclassified Flavobacterium]MBN9285830.1 glycosyltransferase family 4 protein [Flavobacterium sp.]OJV70110.1 MAG: hypothetical protein BGO42_09905 [Flavobacterium sp. 40-81]